MSEDARFEDGAEIALNLKAMDAEDLQIISTLTQDGVFPASEMKWDSTKRQFALLLNRFRWEDATAAKTRNRGYERVQSVLSLQDVLAVSSQGIDRGDSEIVLSLLNIAFEPGPDGTGRVILNLAGDGAIALDVDALDVILKDVTRPYIAPSGAMPGHD